MTGALPVLAEGLGQTPQRIAVVTTLLFLALVIELVRRRRLVERYALLWISASLVLVVLAVWNGALNWIAHWYRDDASLSAAELAERFVELFVNGLAPRPSGVTSGKSP